MRRCPGDGWLSHRYLPHPEMGSQTNGPCGRRATPGMLTCGREGVENGQRGEDFHQERQSWIGCLADGDVEARLPT